MYIKKTKNKNPFTASDWIVKPKPTKARMNPFGLFLKINIERPR